MKIHPYANLFPMCSDDEIQLLADDIAKNGLRQPIVIDADEMILDGRNRSVACKIAGVKPVYEPFPGTEAEKLAYVCSVNIHRRHLTTQQRADIAAKIATMSVGDNQHVATTKEGGSNDPPSKPVSVKAAAKLMNVSPSSVKRAKSAAKPAQVVKPTAAAAVEESCAVKPEVETSEKKAPTVRSVERTIYRLSKDKKRHSQLKQICHAALNGLTSGERCDVLVSQLWSLIPEMRDGVINRLRE